VLGASEPHIPTEPKLQRYVDNVHGHPNGKRGAVHCAATGVFICVPSNAQLKLCICLVSPTDANGIVSCCVGFPKRQYTRTPPHRRQHCCTHGHGEVAEVGVCDPGRQARKENNVRAEAMVCPLASLPCPVTRHALPAHGEKRGACEAKNGWHKRVNFIVLARLPEGITDPMRPMVTAFYEEGQGCGGGGGTASHASANAFTS